MGLAEIFDKSFEILRKYIKTIILYTLGFSVVALIAYVVFIIIGTIIGASIAATATSGMLAYNFMLAYIIIIFFIFFVIGLSSSLQVGIIKISSQEFLNEPIYADQAIKIALKSIFKVLRIIIAAIILFLPVIGIFTFVGYNLFPVFDDLMFYVTQGRNKILLIIFLIILALTAIMAVLSYITILSFSLQAAFIERKGVFSSIKRSYQLVKKNFWKVFGCITLIFLTIYAIYMSLQSFLALILGIVYLIMTFLNKQMNYLTFMSTIYSYTRWPFFIINWLLISPLSTIMVY